MRTDKEKTFDDEETIINGDRLTKQLHHQSGSQHQSIREDFKGALIQFDWKQWREGRGRRFKDIGKAGNGERKDLMRD